MSKYDKIRIVFFHSELKVEGCIDLPFVLRDDFTAELLMAAFECVMQSYEIAYINSDDIFTANVQIAKMPSGKAKPGYIKPGQGAKKKQKRYVPVVKLNNKVIIDLSRDTIQEYCNKKSSIIKVINDDNMCLLRSILIAIAELNNESYKLTYRKQKDPLMKTHLRLIRSKLNLPEDGCGIPEIMKIEAFFEDYCITLIDGHSKSKYYYKGPPKERFIYILYTRSHYNVIKSMPAYLDTSYYCNHCNVGYSNMDGHNCPELCKTCKNSECDGEDKIKCSDCKMIAKNQHCLQRHLDFLCNKRINCKICNNYIQKNHVCINQKYCQKCKEVVSLDHLCYIKAGLNQSNKKEEPFKGFIFFDYEAFQENSIHIPNLIIAHKVCLECLEKEEMCNINCEKICVSDNDTFCKWLFHQKDYIAIAHNSKGYDSIFINDWINENIDNKDRSPDFIRVGTKILSIKFRGVKIICSLSFLPMPLDKFSSTFNLIEDKKGFFPHIFNRRENQNFNGDFPSEEMYQPKFMSEKKRKEFEAWYQKAAFDSSGKRRKFDFQKECISYCSSDVNLLRKGCLSFRKIIMKVTKSKFSPLGIDPFRRAITVASLCHVIFNEQHLEPESIAILSENGITSNERTSKKATTWLKFLSQKLAINIQHSENSKEVQIVNYKCDGFDPITNTVYEFHGCYWHACLVCFKPKTFNQNLRMSFEAINNNHNYRVKKIKESMINGKPIKLIEIWEHEWDKLCKEDEEVSEFISCYEDVGRLDPRNAFFGGRTEAFQLHWTQKEEEKAKYIDVTSLYPSVQKYCKFPLGHPIRILENFKPLEEYFGLFMLKILPPKKLLIPVLPDRTTGQLVFSLCYTCSIKKQELCNHTDEERAFTGTWVSAEVLEAINQGYKVLKIYEVLHFEKSSQYDPLKKEGGLFASFINKFLKIKQQASGFPSNVQTEQEKDQYVQDYFEKEGIMLDKSKISYNEGMRAIAKIILNSFWGRYGMKENKSQYKLISNTRDWFTLMSDDRYIVTSVDFTHKKYLQVYYIEEQDYYETKSNVNVVLAAFITAYGRLKMLSEITKLGPRTLYMDTDSIIFVSVPGLYEPELGNYLGEFTNEICKNNSNYIVAFVSGGAKNYAYITNEGIKKAIVKGFSLNNIAIQTLNYDSIKRIVTTDQSEKLFIEQLLFKRDKINWKISTTTINKKYGFFFGKRNLNKTDYSTLPWGY